ncbi:MAG: ABC transporter ATP-binding protein [Solirubrobacterales bacterium]
MNEEVRGAELVVRGLSRSFNGARAVDDVDLDFGPGGIHALLGPSGCGKTTTLRLIAGLDRPDAGSVHVGGRALTSADAFVPPERRRIGMVFQDYALFPHYDVQGNVAYALGRRPDQSRVQEVLDLVGLSDLSSRPVHELSGGEQQRVALARALAPRPDLILLDEPFSNLDAGLRDRVRADVKGILASGGVTAVFVTHDQEEALSLADTVAMMRSGSIEQIGTPEEVYARPRSGWVAGFLGDVDVIPAIASNGHVECELGAVHARDELDGPVDVLLRPESLAVGSPGPRDGALEAKVVSRRFYGHDQLLEVELPSGRTVRSRRLSFPVWHPGDHVKVWIEGPTIVLPREAGTEPPVARDGAE